MHSPPERRAIVIADMGGGGSQRVVSWLAGAWLASGCEVTVITLSAVVSGETALPVGARRIALGRTGNTGGSFAALTNNFGRIVALRGAIRESGATYVVSLLTATNVLTILATRGLGVRLAVSERNDPSRQDAGRVWDGLRRKLYRFADAVTANSREALGPLRAYVAADKLSFVPNALPDWPEPPPPDSAREPVVLAVGRLHTQKAYDRLLPIFAASHIRSAGFRLVILGEGAERPAIEALRDRLELGDSVSLPGHATDVKAWCDRAAIFVMLSRYEGTPNALLEAISRGLPVVVSHTAGDGPAIVQELQCGFVVDAEDTTAGAALLKRLVADPVLRQRLGTAGRDGIRKMLSDDAIVAAWEHAISPAA